MSISIIVATTTNGAIGRQGDLLYHISDDLRNFKRLTSGHTVIMGRRTFESLPKGPLPDRRNIVITRDPDFKPHGTLAFNSLSSATSYALDNPFEDSREIFIIGGGQIYALALPMASRLYITEIETITQDADTFFPAIDPSEWTTDSQSEWKLDDRSGLRYRFICLSRN